MRMITVNGVGSHTTRAERDRPAVWVHGALTGPAHVLANCDGGEIALKLPVLRPDPVASLSLHEPSLHGILRDDPESWPAVEDLNARLGRVVAALEQGDDAGHMPRRTHPDAYARVVTAFLEDIAAPSSKATDRSGAGDHVSQPALRAIRIASMRLRAPVLLMALDK